MKKYVCFLILFLTLSSYAQDTDSTSSFESNKQAVGELDATQKLQFFGLLEKITSKEINTEVNTIIHFYQENSPDLKKSIKNRRYWRWIKSYPKKINAFVICSKESEIDVSKSKNLHIDNYNIIKRLFLKDSSATINHIIIQPDGAFKIIHGPRNILEILDSSI